MSLAKHPANGSGKPPTIRNKFVEFAKKTSNAMGSVWAFVMAILVIVVWGATGPVFHYSDTWQLVINTGTTVVTFLMVFLIQSTQNRDAKAIHLKLDELIRAMKGARNNFVDLESLSEEELESIAEEFARFGQRACREVERRKAGRAEESMLSDEVKRVPDVRGKDAEVLR